VLSAGAALPWSAAPARLLPPPFCRIFLDPHDKFTRVVPPQQPSRTGTLTADARLSTITVHYGPGFPGPAQVAFQAAADIWQTQVSSPINIVIDAHWVDFGNPLLLGEAGANCAFHDFSGAPRPGTWFVSSLAERLAGTFLSQSCASQHEIAASFNSTANWYLGTDGVPTAGTVDFVSVVLHELGHGLGFIGTGNVAGGLGTVRESGLPFIYDANVVDSAGTSILDGTVYPNGSTMMASLLQGSGVSGSGLFWGGANGIAQNANARPRLYAPASFQNGSSYSHLDENTYPAGDLNSLMTPLIGTAEVIHTPGPIALGMFTDIGWGNQTGGSCSFGLDRYTADVPSAGGSVKVELVTAGGCSWMASTAAPFVSGLAPTSGTTSAAIQMTVAANASSSGRTATVTIGTETFTIAQQGTSPCSNSLAPTSANVGAAAQTGSVTLTSAPGCAWTASSSDPTVATITTDPPSGQDSATVGYAVSGNTGPSVRSATLTIAGQAFAITQAACGYAVDQNTFSVSGAATTVAVNVSTAGSCQWTASTSAPFIGFISGATGTGSGTVQLAIAANPSASPRSGTVTIAGQTVTIAQGPGFPTIAIDKGALVFGATVSGSAFPSQTASQTVRLTQGGPPGTVTWTAASNEPWLTVMPPSGTGTAALTVAVRFDPSLPTRGSAAGQITIALSGAGNSVGPVNVTLNVIPPSQETAPFGSFDTPVSGTTGVSGSLAVTGWTLDDVQVARVTICRDLVTGEAFGPDSRCGGFPKVYIGDGVFIDGARPDVQSTFPGVPLNSRGGWGYLLLTNFLPGGGNGIFLLYAYASDVDGHSTLLGTKTIACDNAHSTAPFGAIDTPGQGDVVGGVVQNFGWVLSPGPRFSDPPDGGVVTVFVDGAPVGSPGGWTSRDDLSGLFDVSKYPGVDSALSVFPLDTTPLANGVHTIAWAVTDNLGTTSGVGSRYFTVSNGAVGLSAAIAGSKDPAYSGAASGEHASATTADVGRVFRPGAGDGSKDPSHDEGILLGRRGFDLSAPLEFYFPDSNGVVTILAHELERIELQLEPGATGALITAQGETPLPIGARIDPATGIFTWAPGAGFVGRYDLVLGAHRVRIVLAPCEARGAGCGARLR